MRRIAAFLLLAGLSQIPLWAGDYFMPGRSLYPTYHETPPPAPVVVSEVRVEPLAPAPVLTPAKVTKPAPKKTTPKSEPVVVKPAGIVAVAEAAVVIPASGTAPVVTPVYGKTVGVELLPPTGMGRAVSATPPAGTPLVSVTAEKPAAVRGARPATVASATTEAIVPVPVPIPGMVATRTEYALPNAPFAAPASVVSIQAVHEMQNASPVKATKKGSAKAPTETLVPVAVTLPGTTITRTEYVAVKTPFAAPASVPVIPVAAAAPGTPLARVFAPTRPVVPVQYIAPAPTPVPTGAAPAAAPVYTGGECPTCGRGGSCDSGGIFSGRLRSWFLFQPTTRNALPRLQPTPYTGPVLAWRCDGNCPPGSYWGGCNTPGHCSGAGCGAAGGCATGTCASGTCGGARAAVAGATCGLGGRLGLGLGGSCKTGCTPAADDAIAGHRFANGGTQPVWGTAPVAGPVTTTSYKPAAARTMDAPSQFYKPSYGTDAAPAAGVAPASGNVLARPFTRP